jgi:hypothetical protein
MLWLDARAHVAGMAHDPPSRYRPVGFNECHDVCFSRAIMLSRKTNLTVSAAIYKPNE